MGQYQQWLFAQEIDRRLKAEIETLETEFFYLQDRITILEQVVPATENVILQALVKHLENHSAQEQEVEKGAQAPETSTPEIQPAQAILSELVTPHPPTLPESVASLPHSYSQREMSEDMLAFFDKRSQTDPRLSALLQRERQRVSMPGANEPLLDEETRRLNENIQRWFIRWHRQVTSDGQAEEVEHEQ